MKKSLKILLPSLCLTALALFLFLPSPINSRLENRDIPTLPGSYKYIGSTSGGLFSKWFILVVNLDAEGYAKYQAKLAADAHETLTIGKDVILARDYKSDENSELNNKKECVTYAGTRDLSCWDPDRITSGTLCRKKLPDACDYFIFFDHTRKRVFIYWHYS